MGKNHLFRPKHAFSITLDHFCSFQSSRILLILSHVKTGSKKIRHFQKLAISEKSTFFVPSSWNLVKKIASWGNHFHQVSWGYNQKCVFFTNGQFFEQSNFFDLDFDKVISKSLYRRELISCLVWKGSLLTKD